MDRLLHDRQAALSNSGAAAANAGSATLSTEHRRAKSSGVAFNK